MTKTTYELAGTGYMRPTTATLPAGPSTTTTYAYYGRTEAAVTTCAGAAANQGEALKSTTGATPAAPAAALVHTYAYDAAGRVIGAAVAGNWTCTAYDARGRVTSVNVPAYNTEPAHAFTYNYMVGAAPNANPLVSSVAEGSATATTTVDLLGRVVSYTDTWNKTTTTTYDQAGRATDTSGPAGAATSPTPPRAASPPRASTGRRWPPRPTTPPPASWPACPTPPRSTAATAPRCRRSPAIPRA